MAEVKVGGEWLSLHGRVADLTWSTKWDDDAGASGCWEASCALDYPARGTPEFLRRGQAFEVWDGDLVWSGVLSEPEQGVPWRLYARGWAREAERFVALDSSLNPTTEPDTAVSAAVTRGLGWLGGYTALGSDAVTSTTNELNRLDAVLTASAREQSMRWAVWADRVLVASADPTTPDWVAAPGTPILGAADEEYVSALYGRYVSAVSGTPPQPSGYATVTASDPAAAERWGTMEDIVNLTGLGLMTAQKAGWQTSGRFAQVGGRMGYTNSLDLAAGEITTLGGVPARLGWVRAGQMLRLHNLFDANGALSVTGAVDIVIAGTTYRDGDPVVRIDPQGLVPRTLSEILAAPEPRESSVTVSG